MRLLLLGASANSRLNVAWEFRNISQIWPGPVMQFPSIEVSDVQAELYFHKPSIVHISAHGTENWIQFDGHGSEQASRLSKGDLVKQINNLHKRVQKPLLMVLNTCESQAIAQCIHDHANVNCVIGTTGKIGDMSAFNFSCQLYQKLGASIQQAHNRRVIREAFNTAVIAAVGSPSPYIPDSSPDDLCPNASYVLVPIDDGN